MIEEYLRVLATSRSIEEFKLKLAIQFDDDLDEKKIKEYEDDYLRRISCSPLYVKKFVKDGKIDLRRCFESKLPVLISNAIVNDNCIYRFYDHYGKEQEFSFNYTLAQDLKAMHGIDTDSMMMSMLEYELEQMK